MSKQLQRQRDVLRSIGPSVAELIGKHEDKQRLWFPTELLEEDWKPTEISPELMAVLVTNMLTEEGLPHFFGLLVTHLGAENPWKEWINVWTAEEDRHGKVLDRYLKKSLSREQMIAVEQLEYGYLRAGFNPKWNQEPYRLLAYVVLQERATQISHKNVAEQAAKQGEHSLCKMLGRIAGEEAKHFAFFRSVFGLLLKADPTGAITALAKVLIAFRMPGVGIPRHQDLFDITMRANVFTGDHLHDIVMHDVISHFDLEHMSDLGSAERSRERIMRFPRMAQEQAKAFRNKVSRQVVLPFLPEVKLKA